MTTAFKPPRSPYASIDRVAIASALELLPLAGVLMFVTAQDIVYLAIPLLFASGAGWLVLRQWWLVVLFALGRAALVVVPIVVFARTATCDDCGQYGLALMLWFGALFAQPLASAAALARFGAQRR